MEKQYFQPVPPIVMDKHNIYECCTCKWHGRFVEANKKNIPGTDLSLLTCPKCNNYTDFTLWKKESIDFDGRDKTLLIYDRMRDVIYNGNETTMNIYGCSSCKEDYIFEYIDSRHNFCPLCGTEYLYIADISV
ncbi:MAG TPA: hypothetical protein PKC41_09615 [Chitinophagaceae bacterium]|jgi:Zn finger protein HypA/HybF involved in hydrogenase expression|nr:hypothetical protein [Chitinophagaceae bacterium]